MRRRQGCAVYMADVSPPISFDDSNHTAGRLLRGAGWDSHALFLHRLLFLDEHLVFALVFGVFGVVVF